MSSEILIYQTEDGQTKIQTRFENETVWLTQEQIVVLFQRDQSVISRHIKNVFDEGELDKESNMQNLHITNPAAVVFGVYLPAQAAYRADRKSPAIPH